MGIVAMSLKMLSHPVDASILTIRGQRVLLDADLAVLYGVPTKALNRAVKRNRERFPADFMFQLTTEEVQALRYQNGTSILRSQSGTSNGRGGRRYLPYVFTEQGVAMLSSVLRSKRAIQVNIEIMRAFVRFRAMAAGHRDLLQRLDALERRYDARFKKVFEAIRLLVELPASGTKRPVGFRPSSALGSGARLRRQS